MALPASTSLDCRGRALSWSAGTLVMGILNVTPDSFSDGGRFSDPAAAAAEAERMVLEGAAVIDVGGQSTRPGHVEIAPEEENARVCPVIERLADRGVLLSIDTYKPEVARAAFRAGAHILNDVCGLQGPGGLAEIVAEYQAPVIAMHQEKGFRERGGDPMDGLKRFFERTVAIATRAGIPATQLVLDPGIGFFKTQEQNLALVGRLAELRSWGFPVLLGASRKSFIGNVLGLPTPERLEGTLATTALAAWQGVEIVRVHDVAANVRVVRMVAAIQAAARP